MQLPHLQPLQKGPPFHLDAHNGKERPLPFGGNAATDTLPAAANKK